MNESAEEVKPQSIHCDIDYCNYHPRLRKVVKLKDLPVRFLAASMNITLLAAPSIVRLPAIVDPEASASQAYARAAL